jgi:hypothetical protein
LKGKITNLSGAFVVISRETFSSTGFIFAQEAGGNYFIDVPRATVASFLTTNIHARFVIVLASSLQENLT